MGWRETLAAVAPTVATALGGPLAGMAVTMAADALGIEADEKAIEKLVLGGSPETMVKLKELDTNFKLKMKELGIKEKQLHAQDRDSARKREMKIGGNFTSWLAFLIMFSFFAIIAYVLVIGLSVSPAIASMIGILIGNVSSKAEQVCNYYFGSSAGSKQKTNAMSDQIKEINKKG